MKFTGKLIIGLVVGLCMWSASYAVPLDLSTFTADPGVVVGSASATFYEDFDYCAWYLYDDNFLVADDATILSFDYSLSYGPDDFADYFVFELDFFPELEVFSPASGYFEIDLAPYQGQVISLAWGLIWSGDDLDLDAGTVAAISSIDLATEGGQPEPVPEPGTMMLLGSGLVGLAGLRRKILQK